MRTRLGLVLFLATSSALATDIQVPAGRSIVNTVNHAAPGDRVLVRAGLHPGGGWIERSGTATAPITVLASDGPRTAVIRGGFEALRVGNSAYLVFDGLEVRASQDNAIHIDGSHHITLRNMYAHDAGPDGDVLKVNQSHHFLIERSEFARPGPRPAGTENPYQECLDFVDVDDSVIRDNWIHDGGSMLAFVKGGSRNTVIERNVFSQQRAGASDPMVGLGGATDLELLQGEQYEAINIIFRNNVLLNGRIGALGVYDANGAYIANNLFLNNDRTIVEFRAGNGPAARSTTVRFVNNLVVDTRGQMPAPYRLSSHGLSDFAGGSDLFWNAGSPIPASVGVQNATAQPSLIMADPGVATPVATADRATVIATVRPATGAARGSGLDASGAPYFVTDDILAVARVQPFDRGPFLLSGAAPPPPSSGCTLAGDQTRRASADSPTTACAPHPVTVRLSRDCCDWYVGRCYLPSAMDLACGP